MAIIGRRKTGKTKTLIDVSHATGYPIITADGHMAKAIEQQAGQMGIWIPRPVSAYQYMHDCSCAHNSHVLIDEVGMVASSIIGADVAAASIDGAAIIKATSPAEELSNLSLWQAFKLWRSERKRTAER